MGFFRNIVSGFSQKSMASKMNKLDNTDDHIVNNFEGIELDFTNIQNERKKSRSEAQKLKTVLARVDKNKNQFNKAQMQEVFAKEDKEIQKFEKQILKQVDDIHKIIEGLDNLSKNEILEIIYDLRLPLLTFDSFTNQLRSLIENKHSKLIIDSKTAKNIKNEIEQIKNIYFGLINDMYKHVQEDIVARTTLTNTDNLLQQIKQRTYTKRQMQGKRLQLLKRIKEIESIILKLKKSPAYAQHKETHEMLYGIIVNYKKNFEELTQYYDNRILSSKEVIREAKGLKLKHMQDLETMKKEVDEFYKMLAGLPEQVKAQGIKDKVLDDVKDFDATAIELIEKEEKIITKEIQEEESLLKNALKNAEKVKEDFVLRTKVLSEEILNTFTLDNFKGIRKILIWTVLGVTLTQPTISSTNMNAKVPEQKIVMMGSPQQVEAELSRGQMMSAGTVKDNIREINSSVKDTINIDFNIKSGFSRDYHNFDFEANTFDNFGREASAGLKKEIEESANKIKVNGSTHVKRTIPSGFELPADYISRFANLPADSIIADANIKVKIKLTGISCAKGSGYRMTKDGLKGFDANRNLAGSREQMAEDAILQKLSRALAEQGIDVTFDQLKQTVERDTMIVTSSEGVTQVVSHANEWLKNNEVRNKKGKIKSINQKRLNSKDEASRKSELDNFDRVLEDIKQKDANLFKKLIDLLNEDRGVDVEIEIEVEKPIKFFTFSMNHEVAPAAITNPPPIPPVRQVEAFIQSKLKVRPIRMAVQKGKTGRDASAHREHRRAGNYKQHQNRR